MLKLSSKAEERQALGVYQGAGDGEGGYTMIKQSEKVDERQALVGGGRRRCAAQQRGVRDAGGALRVDPGFSQLTPHWLSGVETKCEESVSTERGQSRVKARSTCNIAPPQPSPL